MRSVQLRLKRLSCNNNRGCSRDFLQLLLRALATPIACCHGTFAMAIEAGARVQALANLKPYIEHPIWA
jgi:hypothetical protein